ncbi:MAG: ACP S-malonyltransferase [Cytophagales bacterium]|nr:ACP S-malonyltransferase [Armatimonadota bacterium]
MKLAFVFPGQGAQFVGMGRDLYENSGAAQVAFETVDDACGFSVSRLCFEGPDDALKETRNTQPALFAVSVAALAACREAGLFGEAVAGHSIGEYAALVAAGALNVVSGARLVKARADAMADVAARRPGAMAAVLGLDAAVIAEVCRQVNHVGVVVMANLNAPGQIVISGEVNAINEATLLLREKGAKRVLPLAVSGAFHSPLMEPASAVLRGVLELTAVDDPKVPVVANVTADYETSAAEVRANLAAQVAGPVRWTETIERLAGSGYTTFIECGPGSVLAGLIKRIAPEARTFSVGDTASLRAAKEAIGL